MFALGSAGCSPLFSAVFLPTNLLFGCLGTAAGSSTIPSSTSGPRFVATRSSSILLVACSARRGVEVGWHFWPQNVRRAELDPDFLPQASLQAQVTTSLANTQPNAVKANQFLDEFLVASCAPFSSIVSSSVAPPDSPP